MAVPKKKTSKSKRDFRRYIWNKKSLKLLQIAVSVYKLRFNQNLAISQAS